MDRVVHSDRHRRALEPGPAPPTRARVSHPEATQGSSSASHECWPSSSRGGGPRYPDWFREDFLALLELLRTGKVHPVVAERLPLSDAHRAHERLESSAATGKLVLIP